MQMQIFTTFKTEFELAQIEEVEKSDMIEVLDPPQIPLYKSGPSRKILMIFSIVLSAFICVLFFTLKRIYAKYLTKLI